MWTVDDVARLIDYFLKKNYLFIFTLGSIRSFTKLHSIYYMNMQPVERSTGCTTGCKVYTFIQQVVQPVVQRWQRNDIGYPRPFGHLLYGGPVDGAAI